MLNKRSKSIIALLLVTLLIFAAGCSAPKQAADSSAPAATKTDSSAPSTAIARPEGVPADFPSKEIHYLYGFSAGSANDAYFRILADKVKSMQGWKNGFVVDYKTGASGKIEWDAISKAKPDGYTIGFTPSAMLIPVVAEKATFGVDNMAYVANMMTDPGVIAVAKDSPYNTLQDIIEAAKKNPGKVSFGVTSTIAQEGLTLKLIQKVAGVQFNVVPFDGESEVMAGVVGKHVDALCLNITDIYNAVQEGQLKAIATGDTQRAKFMPDVPTYKEAGYDVTQVNMRAIGVPKDTPEPIRQYLEQCFMAAANDPEVQAKVAEMKIPVENVSGTDVKAKFTTIQKTLQDLWNANPWQ
ncbi:MAG: tripartite tricarboxylate transporter substrate binding protein [Caulobacteraceae bacterium]